MDVNTTINYMKDVIKNYINDFDAQRRIAHNMFVRHNDSPAWSVKQAFMLEMQGATSEYAELSESEREKVAGSLWHLLKNKNHNLTKLW